MQIEHLVAIKGRGDIKALAIIERFEDDNLACARIRINGIKVELMWRDHLSFLDYYEDSEKALQHLLMDIRFACYEYIDNFPYRIKQMAELHARLHNEFYPPKQ